MGPIGVPEMLFILAIALLIFGPKRLPEFGRTIGKALGEFRRATADLKRSIDVEIATAEPATPEPKRAPAPPAAQPVARASSPGDGADDAGAATPTDEPAEPPAEEEPESPSGS